MLRDDPGILAILVTDSVGGVHLAASVAAVVCGTLVLALEKGTVTHKRVGYVYATSMVVVLVTSFMMYHLFGGWGVFHWTALLGTLTLLAGMVPILTRRPSKSYVALHFSFMYWSVIGLYAALVAEIFARIPRVVFEDGAPNSLFYVMIASSGVLTLGLGTYGYVRNLKRWEARYSR